MPYLSFAAICLLFGSNFILMDRAGLAFGPVEVGASRVAGAAVVLGLVWALFARGQAIPRAALPKVALIGVLANAYPYVAQPWLLAEGKRVVGDGVHSFFGMMVAFTPLLTILASIPMLRVWPTTRQLGGVLVGLVFMGLLMLDGSARGITPGMLALSFSIPLSYAVGNTYMRRHLSGVPSTALTAGIFFAASVLLVPASQFDGPLTEMGIGPPAEPQAWPLAIAAVVGLGLLGTGLTMWLFVRLVQTEGPLFAGMVTYVVPLIALLWGVFDGETITGRQLVAIAGVLGSVALVQYGATRREPKASAETEPPADVAAAAGEV